MTTYGHHAIADAREHTTFLPAKCDPILHALARAIGVAHELGPKMWAVTLLDDLVRLTFGPVEVFVIFGDGAWYPVKAGRSKLPPGVEREAPPHQWFGGADRLIGPHREAATAFDEHIEDFEAVVRHVRGRFKVDHFLNGAAKKAHARGLLAYLEERLDVKLPRPAWDDEYDLDADAPLAEEAVFTALSREGIEEGRAVFEDTRWSRALRSLEAAKARGHRMPILFGDAVNSVQTLLGWAIVRDIRITDDSTTVTYEDLRGLLGHSASELIKLSNGEHIDEGYQRAYVPCRTPDFLRDESAAPEDLDFAEVEGIEGRRKLQAHVRLERDLVVVRAAKRTWAARNPLLRCEVCGFSAAETYGHAYCEAHHRVPLASLEGERTTKVDDLACLCANCHRALHRDANATVDELRRRLATTS